MFFIICWLLVALCVLLMVFGLQNKGCESLTGLGITMLIFTVFFGFFVWGNIGSKGSIKVDVVPIQVNRVANMTYVVYSNEYGKPVVLSSDLAKIYNAPTNNIIIQRTMSTNHYGDVSVNREEIVIKETKNDK